MEPQEPTIKDQLSELFYPEEIEWLPGRTREWNGQTEIQMFPYIQSRAVEDRLDRVVGIANWKTHDLQMHKTREEIYDKHKGEKREVLLNGFTVGLSLKLGDEWVSRFNGSDMTNFEGFKGGISGSIKRVAVDWGIGRYLYKIKDLKAIIHPDGDGFTKFNNNWINFFPPRLPNWAIPGDDEVPPNYMLEELISYFQNGSKNFKKWVITRWHTMSRRDCYVAIKRQQENGIRITEFDLKEFKKIHKDNLEKYKDGDSENTKKESPDENKKELKKSEEQKIRDESRTSADELDSSSGFDIMNELGID